MNKSDRMSFKGFIFTNNPSVIKIKHRVKLVRNSVPFGVDNTRSFGRKACEISGEGDLVGKDCAEQFAKLRKVFFSGGSGLLLLPGLEPFYAFFESFELLEEPSDELIRYSFAFCEDTSAKHFENSQKQLHTVMGGETLWDISYKYGIAVEGLLDNNPNIIRPDAVLNVGEVIRLC